MVRIIDISKLIHEGELGFPTEPRTTFNGVCAISELCPVRVTQIVMSSHAGTHCDAPSHVWHSGSSVHDLLLDHFIGQCQVVDLSHIDEDITLRHIDGITIHERMIIKLHERDSENFTCLSVECIDHLAVRGVRLLGVNTVSVDHFYSKDLPIHKSCFKHGIAIVEKLELTHVKPGGYIFIGLPLKLKDLDASPIRAVLLEGGM